MWLDVGRSLRLNETEPGWTCLRARAQGYDTIQLLRSFAGYAYEILDCRGAADSNPTWTQACPPPHVPLRWGLPARRFAPALAGVSEAWGGSCACDAARDYLNCGNATRPCDDASDSVLASEAAGPL